MSDVFGKKLGNYILLEQLGEGGMAKVYNALDSRAERNVAIKVILPSRRSSQLFLQQFETEAKALANLTHTNIVKVFNYGIDDGQPYLVMDFIPGGTLKEAMTKPIPWQTAAMLLAPIARALDYVHQQQIVHRDVKPSNILLYEDFRPMLSDFGIVKLLDSKEENINSAIGVGVGTPEYMSPEQGMGKEVDFRADIYSLGLVFYEMVTGQKPFTADTPMAAILRHITDDLTLPSKIDRSIPKFVEKAIVRAVQKNPEDRYASMGSFADVLEMIALGEKAPTKRILDLSKQKVKKSKPNFMVMVVLMLIAGIGALVMNGLYGSKPQLGGEVNTTILAGINDKTVTSSAPTSSPTRVLTATVSPQLQPTLPSVNPFFPDVTLLGTPLNQNRSNQFAEIAKWGIGGVNVIKWSPDGTLIALGSTSGIFLYDSNNKELILFINTDFNVIEMSFSPDGENIVAGSPDGVVKAWNVKGGRYIRDFTYVKPKTDNIGLDKRVNVIIYSQNGKNIAIGYKDGTLNYFMVDQKSPDIVIEEYPSVEDIILSTDNRFIYVSNGTNNVFVWDVATKKKINEISYPSPINKLKLSKDGQFLFSGGSANFIYMLDLFEERIMSSFSNLGGLVTDFDLSYDGNLVAISLNTGIIKIFNIPAKEDYSKTHLPLLTINSTSDQIRSLAFSPDQLVIASGSWEDGLKIWDTQAENEVLYSFDKNIGGVNEIYFSQDGAWLATSHEDGNVRLWRVSDAQEAYQLSGYLPKGIPFSPNNQFLAMIRTPEKYKPEVIQILELSSGNIVAELSGYQPNTFVQFSDDSKIFVSGNTQKAIIWDVSTWEQIKSQGGMNAGCGRYFTLESNLLAVISNAQVFFSDSDNIRDMCASKPDGATLVYYFPSQHKIYFVQGDGKLWNWNFHSADFYNKKNEEGASYPFIKDVFLSGDQESGWYAYNPPYSDQLIIVVSNQQFTLSRAQDDYHFRVALSPNKKLIALGSKYGSIHIWTTP